MTCPMCGDSGGIESPYWSGIAPCPLGCPPDSEVKEAWNEEIVYGGPVCHTGTGSGGAGSRTDGSAVCELDLVQHNRSKLR